MRIYNSATHKKEEFQPIESGKVRMYVCGPTVYDNIHIGNARTFISFDVIRRWLIASGYEVTFAQNLTDVDDKIINRANEQGRTAAEVATEFSDKFIGVMRAANVLDPDVRPRATKEIGPMIAMIKTLIEQGHAYAADNGDVYFAVRSDPNYGQVSGRNIDDLMVGARIEENEDKNDPLDFALWKAAKPGEPSWPSPWGEGRPGWHTECAAMVHRYLGTPIDIHGGGSDLAFPHHENECAQATCAWHQGFSNTWMHTGMLLVDGEKMSKSLGNFFTLAEVLEQHSAAALRLLMLQTSYRSPLDFSWERLEGAENSLTRIAGTVENLRWAANHATADADEAASEAFADKAAETRAAFKECMDDDFNTAGAMGAVFGFVTECNQYLEQAGDAADKAAALAAADTLVADDAATTEDLRSAASALDSQYAGLRTLPETNTSIPGTTGTVIKADTGLPMQAHGGSAMALKEGTGDGCVNYDLDGDGDITEGKAVYLWFGEDKTNNTRPVDGVRCYSSTDLYNWTDRGTILYTQSTILPIEEGTEKAIISSPGASGTGTTQDYNVMQLSATNLETLKAWGKLSAAPEGVTESQFRNVKNFLRAYVTEYEKAPTDLNDISWTAKSYDEEPITATSLLYPDSQDDSVRNVTTTRLQLAFETLYGSYCVTERPKMIYNESTKQFVLIWHADGPLYNNDKLNSWVAGGCVGNCPASRYSRAMVGIATSDSPFGPFTVQNVTRMNYDTSLNASRLGEARDMTVFVDTGVDKNNDGADDAYVIYSSEMNAKLYVSLLNKDYTGLAAEADQADATEFAARIVSDDSREAPAVFKYNGYYYLLTSGTDGWNSTCLLYTSPSPRD